MAIPLARQGQPHVWNQIRCRLLLLTAISGGRALARVGVQGCSFQTATS